MEHERIDEAAFGTSGVESTTATASPPTREPGPTERFVLAGIGAVATAIDEADAWYERFVDRGQRVQTEWKERAEDIRLQNAGTRYRVRDALRNAMDAFLDTVNVPNKGDVDTINVKLNILTRKIDDLQMQTGGGTGPESATPPPPAVSDLGT
jgi:polyhydroxyalkanoate synthesis regulator phasin